MNFVILLQAPMIPHGDLFWMNIFGDLEDLEPVLDINDEFNKTRIFGSGSCSALIKVNQFQKGYSKLSTPKV